MLRAYDDMHDKNDVVERNGSERQEAQSSQRTSRLKTLKSFQNLNLNNLKADKTVRSDILFKLVLRELWVKLTTSACLSWTSYGETLIIELETFLSCKRKEGKIAEVDLKWQKFQLFSLFQNNKWWMKWNEWLAVFSFAPTTQKSCSSKVKNTDAVVMWVNVMSIGI